MYSHPGHKQEYLTKYIPILSIHEQYTGINASNTSPIHIVGKTEVWVPTVGHTFQYTYMRDAHILPL
jgi:hypothetical protein